MGSARRTLLDIANNSDPYRVAPEGLDELRLQAAQEVFAEQREQIPLLANRAKEGGIAAIRTYEDLVPLLLADNAYKSYPQSFVKKGQWDRMNQWLTTVSVPTVKIDVEGCRDFDDWIERLWAAGHYAGTTSGTSGKVSVLNRTQGDIEFYRRSVEFLGWPTPLPKAQERHYYMLGPKDGPYTMNASSQAARNLYAKPDSQHFLSNDRMRVVDISRMAEMRLRMADGSATPEEIANFEKEAAKQAEKGKAGFDALVSHLVEHRHEPQLILGLWGQLLAVMARAKQMGIAAGDWCKETVFAGGGGRKGIKLPDDFRQQFREYFPFRIYSGYGLSEMNWVHPMCSADRYHEVPWVIGLVLDKAGEVVLNRKDRVVEGRYAFLDLSFNGRWGGLITGDKVKLDFSDNGCPCGRPGRTFLPDINRYKDLEGEDHIGCAGTIDAYIRGAFAT